MLLPSLYRCLADVVAWRLMDLPTVGVGGRWNSHWVNVLGKFWCFVQDLIPYVWQIVFAYVSI